MHNRYRVLGLIAILLLTVSALFAQPAAPSNLTAVRQGDAGVLLQWDGAEGAQFYKIYKSVDDSPFLPIGATEHTSFIDWLVSHDHHFRYFVRAFDHDMGGPPSDTVEFHDGPPPPHDVHGVITGRVTDDSTGLPLREATVRFFGRDGFWRVNVHTDTGGVYWAPIDTGRYVVRAEKFGYVPEWFDNALELSAATVIDVHEDTTVANFGLRPVPVEGPITITGTVRDSLTGQPLAGALVAYMRPFVELRELERQLGLFGGFDWERLVLPGFGRLHGVVWFGFTDSSGQYTAHVRSNHRYIAMAFKPGFIHKFYQNKFTPFEADRISSPTNLTGIDFDLIQNPLASLFLSGTVHDTTNAGVVSHVVLIRMTAIGPRVVRYTSTDSLGDYTFNNLVPGIFLVKAVPVDLFSPAWYSASGCGVRNWHNADTIHLSGDRANVDVCVLQTHEDGCGHVAGMITGGGNILSAAGAEGSTVYAVSSLTNRVAGYDVAEDDGSFSITGLAPGTYYLVADKEGYSPASTPTVSVSASNNFEATGASLTISPDVVLSAPERHTTLPGEYKLDQNYPNPFNPSTTIGFAVPKASNVTLKIYNIIGQEVASLANSTFDGGFFTMQWDGTDHSGKTMGSGIYFVKMTASSLDGKLSFVQTRKIMLMK